MHITVSLNIEDYVYRFYETGAEALCKRPEELMEQALFMYAGIVAQQMIREDASQTGEQTT